MPEEIDCDLCGFNIPSDERIFLDYNINPDEPSGYVHITCLLDSIPATRENVFQLNRRLEQLKRSFTMLLNSPEALDLFTPEQQIALRKGKAITLKYRFFYIRLYRNKLTWMKTNSSDLTPYPRRGDRPAHHLGSHWLTIFADALEGSQICTLKPKLKELNNA